MQSIKHDHDFHYTFHIDNNFFLANNIGLNTVFLGNYLCINSGSSLTNRIKSEGLYVKFVSELPEFMHT